MMPRRQPALEIAEFEDATVVFDPRTNSVHLLDSLAAVLFDACDGATDRDVLIGEIVEALAQDPDDIAAQVDLAIVNFGDLGLLDGVEPIAEPPCIGCGNSTGSRAVTTSGRGRRRGVRRSRA